MNDLLTELRISSFDALLAAYARASGDRLDFNALDGGAGFGETSGDILKHLQPSRVVFAFEPYPGNHKFFKPAEERIILIKKALAETNKVMTFRVPSVVSADSVWGEKGYAGYSSVGYLAAGVPTSETDIEVDCVAADRELPERADVGFIKLDLQGGELNALMGMQALLRNARFLWVEFTNQRGLLQTLSSLDYILFDTEYFLMGEKSPSALAAFDPSRHDVTLSTGQHAWFGFRKHAWHDYLASFEKARSDFRLIQTDLVCVNKRYLSEFIAALACLKT